MNKLIICISLFLVSIFGYAESPLPAAPPTGWCYDTIHTCTAPATGTCYDTHACANVVIVEPPGRQRTAQIKYPNAPGSHGVRTVDLTQWDNLFGHRNETDALTAWPGALGTSPAILQLTGSGYVALQFKPTKKAQVLVNISSYNGTTLDGAWSTRPGDFSGTIVCAATRGPGEMFPKLSTDPSKPGCYVGIGQTAYFNIKLHTPQTTGMTVQLNMTGIVFP